MRSPREELLPRRGAFTAKQLEELVAEFQAIIDSQTGNTARRCASLCLARMEMAAEQERRRQLLALADSVPRKGEHPQHPLPQQPARLSVCAWTCGFYDEKLRSLTGPGGGGEPRNSGRPQESAGPAASHIGDIDGDSSDEDYERILRSAFGLRDKVHDVLQAESPREVAAEVAMEAAAKPRPHAPRLSADLTKILQMTSVILRERVAEEGEQFEPAGAGAKGRAAHIAASGIDTTGGAKSGARKNSKPTSTACSPSPPSTGSVPPPAQAPAPMPPAIAGEGGEEPQGPPPPIRLVLTIRNMNFARLCASPGLLGDMEAGLRDAVAEAVGGEVRPSHVGLALSAGAGSTVARVAVTPPVGVEAEAVQAALAAPAALEAAALGRVSATPGVAAVCTGAIGVCQLGAPALGRPGMQLPPPTDTAEDAADTGEAAASLLGVEAAEAAQPAQRTPRSQTTPSASTPASITTPRLGYTERKARNEDLGKELAEIAAELRRNRIIGDTEGEAPGHGLQ